MKRFLLSSLMLLASSGGAAGSGPFDLAAQEMFAMQPDMRQADLAACPFDLTHDLFYNGYPDAGCLAQTPSTGLTERWCPGSRAILCFYDDTYEAAHDSGMCCPPGLGVGDSLEIPYTLPGPLPAGNYHVTAVGVQESGDAHLHLKLIWRALGHADQILAEYDGFGSKDMGSGNIGVDTLLSVGAVAAHCGDALIVKVDFLSGGSAYLFLDVVATTP